MAPADDDPARPWPASPTFDGGHITVDGTHSGHPRPTFPGPFCRSARRRPPALPHPVRHVDNARLRTPQPRDAPTRHTTSHAASSPASASPTPSTLAVPTSSPHGPGPAGRPRPALATHLACCFSTSRSRPSTPSRPTVRQALAARLADFDGMTVTVTHDPSMPWTSPTNLPSSATGGGPVRSCPSRSSHPNPGPLRRGRRPQALYASGPLARAPSTSRRGSDRHSRPGHPRENWVSFPPRPSSPGDIARTARHNTHWRTRRARRLTGQIARVSLTGEVDLVADIPLGSLAELHGRRGRVWAEASKATEVRAHPRCPCVRQWLQLGRPIAGHNGDLQCQHGGATLPFRRGVYDLLDLTRRDRRQGTPPQVELPRPCRPGRGVPTDIFPHLGRAGLLSLPPEGVRRRGASPTRFILRVVEEIASATDERGGGRLRPLPDRLPGDDLRQPGSAGRGPPARHAPATNSAPTVSEAPAGSDVAAMTSDDRRR